MLSRDEMKALLDESIRLGNELRRFHDAADDPAVPEPPATSKALAEFTKAFGDRVPASYLQLLSIYDGIRNFEWLDVSILPVAFLLKHRNLEAFWVDIDAYEEGELFVFAKSSSDQHAVAFLRRQVDDRGEMRVVHFDAGGPIREYASLEDYLRERRDWYDGYVRKERADRGSLTDDE